MVTRGEDTIQLEFTIDKADLERQLGTTFGGRGAGAEERVRPAQPEVLGPTEKSRADRRQEQRERARRRRVEPEKEEKPTDADEKGGKKKPFFMEAGKNLLKVLGPVAALLGIGLGVAALVKISKVMSTTSNALMSVFGAIIDSFLAPIAATLLPGILRGIAKLIPIAQKWGDKIASILKGDFIPKMEKWFADLPQKIDNLIDIAREYWPVLRDIFKVMWDLTKIMLDFVKPTHETLSTLKYMFGGEKPAGAEVSRKKAWLATGANVAGLIAPMGLSPHERDIKRMEGLREKGGPQVGGPGIRERLTAPTAGDFQKINRELGKMYREEIETLRVLRLQTGDPKLRFGAEARKTLQQEKGVTREELAALIRQLKVEQVISPNITINAESMSSLLSQIEERVRQNSRDTGLSSFFNNP